MIAATIADIDGLGILVPGATGQNLYWEYHHKLEHNLPLGIVVAILLTIWCRRQWAETFVVCLALFHLHLLMDYWGSGPGWHIHYLWPIGDLILTNPRSWEFFSWQNMLVFFIFLIWTLAIAKWQRRTPLEAIMPKLDRQLVGMLKKPANFDA